MSHGPQSSERKAAHWVVLIFLASIAAYAITLGQGFIVDDEYAVVGNAHIRSLTQLPEIFSSTMWAGAGRETSLYRPLTVLSYALNHAMTGTAAWSYHLLNVLLHALCSIMVFALARQWRLPLQAAVAGALIFVVHPVHVEAVTNVAGRKELLATALLLAMLFGHRRALQTGGASLIAPVVAFAGAMLSKEIGVVGIGLVALHDLLLREDGNPVRGDASRRAFLYLSYAIALVVFLIVRWEVVGGLGVATIYYIDNPAAFASSTVRLLTATAVIGQGLALLAFPFRLSPDYSFHVIPLVEAPLEFRFVATVVVVGGFLAWSLAARRKSPVLLLAAGWYFAALLPASNLLVPTGTIFGERILYLPSVAFCLMAGLGLHATCRRAHRAVFASLLAVILVAFTVQTERYSIAWADPVALFSWAAHNTPDSTKAHYNLGAALRDAGRLDEAEKHWQRAISLYPDHAHSLGDLGTLYFLRGEPKRAREYWERAVKVAPAMASAWYNLGLMYQTAGENQRARDAFVQFVRVGELEYPEQVAQIRKTLGEIAPPGTVPPPPPAP